MRMIDMYHYAKYSNEPVGFQVKCIAEAKATNKHMSSTHKAMKMPCK
jgi:hypothetical protein